jgi:hypothetical protein
MNQSLVQATIRNVGSFLVNLLAAMVGTYVAQAPFTRYVHFSPPYRTAMLRADVLTSAVAFGVGFAVYIRWKPVVSRWLWIAGLCWFVCGTFLKLNGNGRSVFDDFGGRSPTDSEMFVRWSAFTVPFLRTVLYSAGAFCCSRWLSRARTVR